MDTAPLTFTRGGQEWKCRRLCRKDYDVLRQVLRRERFEAIPPGMAEAQGAAVARPVTDDELWDYMFSRPGLARLLHACVYQYDQRFTEDDAFQMVVDDDPFILRFKIEARLLVPKLPAASETDSSEKKS